MWSTSVHARQAPIPRPADLDNVAIRIVIAYDSAATGRRAEAIYERLAKRLGENFDFERRLWRFDVLGPVCNPPLERNSLRGLRPRSYRELQMPLQFI